MNLELFPCSLEVWEARVVRIAVLEILITLYKLKQGKLDHSRLIVLLTVYSKIVV